MITQFRVQNFKALRDVTLDLTPIHVLIGPNDSGKTSILQAIAALSRSVDYPPQETFVGKWSGRELVHFQRDVQVSLQATVGNQLDWIRYKIVCGFSSTLGKSLVFVSESLELPKGLMTTERFSAGSSSYLNRSQHGEYPKEFRSDIMVSALKRMRMSIANAHFYRFDPAMLALPVALNNDRGFRMDETGFGLAQCLDEILGNNRRRFDELENRFCGMFPQFETIRLQTDSGYSAPPERFGNPLVFTQSVGKGIRFKLRGSETDIPASQASDGTMLVLAFLAISYLPEPPSLLLIEEPENGIHPARLSDVLKILRTVAEERGTTQVVLTTHSPRVVSQFEPNEVTLCRMEESGEVTVHNLAHSSLVQQQSDLFTLGEIWTGEGDDAIAASANGVKP